MDNSGKEKEAMALMAEDEKKMKSSSSFLGALFGLELEFSNPIQGTHKPTQRKSTLIATSF